jgi:Sortase domain
VTVGASRRPSSRWAVYLVGLVVLASASTIGAEYLGSRSSTGASEHRPLLQVSRPHSLRNTHTRGSAEQHLSRHGLATSVTPAQVAAPAASQIRSQRPVGITLPNGARMSVLPAVTGPTGTLQVPDDIGRAGWWDGSSRIGDPFGSIVIAAHVDSFTQGIGKFAELLDMHRGDEVRLESTNMSQSFRVESAHLVPKASLAADSRVFAPRGGARLVLITCGGPYDPGLGGYQDNMVVIARPQGLPTATR